MCTIASLTVSSSSSSITPLVHAVLTALLRLRSCVWLTDWLTASSSRRRRKEERAAASRQPISGSRLANVQPRGSSTTVSATGRATSLKLGYYGDKEREHFAGSPPLSPPRSCSVPPHFTPLFLSLTTGHSVSQPPSPTQLDRRQHPRLVAGLCDEVGPPVVAGLFEDKGVILLPG